MKAFSSKIKCVVVALAIVIAPNLLRAEETPPDLVEINTPVYRPDFSKFEPSLGSYDYSVTWKGIPAASIQLKVNQDDENYKVIAIANTNSMVSLFYRLRYRAEGLISGLDLMPLRSVMQSNENSRKNLVEMSFHKGSQIESVSTGKKGSEVVSFKSHNFTLDPFSAAFIARGLDWKVGQEARFDVFNGKTRYLLEFKATDKRDIWIEGVKYSSWVIEPKVSNLTNPSKDKKFKSAKIFLSADKSRDILKIESKVFIGTVITQLTSFTPAPEGTQPVVVAWKKASSQSAKN